MGLIDRAAAEADIKLERDVPVRGHRRCRDWSRLIGIARKLEAEEETIKTAETRKIAQLADEKAALQGRIYDLEMQLANYKLRARISEVGLSDKDQQFLLGSGAEKSNGA